MARAPVSEGIVLSYDTRMNVLVACEYSGNVRDAFIARGHDAMSCDLLPTDRPGPHYQGDVRDILYSGGWDLLIAHPPCTRLTLSGLRWLHTPPKGRTLAEMWAELEEAAMFYRLFQEAPIPKKGIENPRMHKHAKERVHARPRQVVQPHWFGVPEFKATGWELTGLPVLQPSAPLAPPAYGTDEYKKWSIVHRETPGPDRWKRRSTTRPGVAAALAQQWG